MMKIANTRQMLEINQHAADDGYNQYVDPKMLSEIIDPDGLHVLTDVMVHEHKQGVLVDPHLRCIVMIKARGTTQPYQALLDVEFDAFNALPGQEEVTDLQAEFVENWNATL